MDGAEVARLPDQVGDHAVVMSARITGIAAISITSLLWGTTGTAATFAPDVSPLAIGAAALGLGGLLQALIALPALGRQRATLWRRRGTVLTGAIAVAVYPLAFYSSMHLAGVAIGSVVSLASAPIASGLLERLIDRRPLSRWWQLSAGLGVLGSILLCASSMDAPDTAPWATVAGITLGLLAGLTYATYSWVAHRLMGSGVGRGASMGSVFGLGGLLLMPALAVTGAPILHNAVNVSVVAYLALVPMFLGYVLFGLGLTKVPASTATTVTLTEPAIATILAVVVVGERLSPAGWGGLSIIGTVLLILAVAPTQSRSGTTPT